MRTVPSLHLKLASGFVSEKHWNSCPRFYFHRKFSLLRKEDISGICTAEDEQHSWSSSGKTISRSSNGAGLPFIFLVTGLHYHLIICSEGHLDRMFLKVQIYPAATSVIVAFEHFNMYIGNCVHINSLCCYFSHVVLLASFNISLYALWYKSIQTISAYVRGLVWSCI